MLKHKHEPERLCSSLPQCGRALVLNMLTALTALSHDDDVDIHNIHTGTLKRHDCVCVCKCVCVQK